MNKINSKKVLIYFKRGPSKCTIYKYTLIFSARDFINKKDNLQTPITTYSFYKRTKAIQLLGKLFFVHYSLQQSKPHAWSSRTWLWVQICLRDYYEYIIRKKDNISWGLSMRNLIVKCFSFIVFQIWFRRFFNIQFCSHAVYYINIQRVSNHFELQEYSWN